MVVTVDDVYMPLTLTAPGITDEQFQELCEQYEDYRVEYTAEGDLLVMPLPIRRQAPKIFKLLLN